jgi:hypothetical protein
MTGADLASTLPDMQPQLWKFALSHKSTRVYPASRLPLLASPDRKRAPLAFR